MSHEYVCERNGRTVCILDRKSPPKIGKVITAYGSKWQVWYIEYEPSGKCRARLEPFSERAAA